MDREERVRELKERMVRAEKCYEEWGETDKLTGGDRHLIGIWRIGAQLHLLSTWPSLLVEEIHHGILINGKYIVAIRQNKWKVVGKNKWYRYKSLDHLVENYILSKPQKWANEPSESGVKHV